MNHQEALTSYIAAFVGELAIAGVKDVVVSPGSRSTPIALVMAEHPELNLHVHVDERSAAFFALGIAKAKQKPVAVLCTSGTAAANYYPAVIEAEISRVPLLFLTADRPHELRDVGAPQAIDQIHLYGKHVKWFVEMSPPEGGADMVRYARTVCARAAATASRHPAGPVHLNFPLREPLIPALDDVLFSVSERDTGYVQISQGTITLSDSELDEISNHLLQAERGIIVCGPLEQEGFAEAVVALAESAGFPILADPLSQLRSGKHSAKMILDAYDTFLRDETMKEQLKPDLIIRFGAMPVSKALSIFIKENRQAKQMVVDGGGGWRDPLAVATDMIFCDEADLCRKVGSRLEGKRTSAFIEKWLAANDLAKSTLATIESINELSEGKLFYLLQNFLPERSTLFVGNSMPIRDLDTFFFSNDKEIRIMANRGANGIDGIISTALGAASASEKLYLVIGDLTFFHDMNGLLAAKLYQLDITIILMNNNGGGIFSFLPQASHPKHFEQLFGTPLGLDYSYAVQMYGGELVRVTDWNHFADAFASLEQKRGLKVIEVMTDRERNLIEHRNLWKAVSREIAGSQEKGK